MSAYIGDVVKNGLVLYLDAANSKSYVSGSSTWFDLSGNGSGTLTNGPTFSSDGKGSIVFDGSNDFVNQSLPSLNLTDFSFSAWTKGSGTMFGSGVQEAWPKWWSFEQSGFSFKPVSIAGQYIIYTISIPSPITSSWNMVSYVRNGSTMYAYQNGILVNTYNSFPTNALVTYSNWGQFIGKNKIDINQYTSEAFFNGNISQVSMYNRALSAAEILENYNATKGRFDTPRAINSVQPRLVTNGLVMCLDAGNRESYVSGSATWFDLSGNNNGTLTNGPTFNSSNGGNVVFDGTNDYVEVSTRNTNLEFQPTQAYSVFGWFYNIGSGAGALVSNMYNTGTFPGWDLFNTEANTIGMHLISSWPANAIKVKINFNYSNYTSAWVYFGYTYNGSCPTNSANSLNSVNFYQNGILNADGKVMSDGTDGFNTTSETTSYNSSQRLRIGSRWLSGTASSPLSFRNSMVQIYNRVLSDAEILQNYNALKGRFGL